MELVDSHLDSVHPNWEFVKPMLLWLKKDSGLKKLREVEAGGGVAFRVIGIGHIILQPYQRTL